MNRLEYIAARLRTDDERNAALRIVENLYPERTRILRRPRCRTLEYLVLQDIRLLQRISSYTQPRWRRPRVRTHQVRDLLADEEIRLPTTFREQIDQLGAERIRSSILRKLEYHIVAMDVLERELRSASSETWRWRVATAISLVAAITSMFVAIAAVIRALSCIGTS